MKKLRELYRTNRVFRTAVQAFVGYITGNLTAAITIMNSQNWWKVLLINLVIPAGTTAFAQITKYSYTGGEG